MATIFCILGLFCLLTTWLLVGKVRTKKLVISRVTLLIVLGAFPVTLVGTVIGALAGATFAGCIVGGLTGYALSTGFILVLENMKLGPY